MPKKIPTASARRILDALSATALVAGARLKLFQNNHTPADADTAADYTEATFDGYANVGIGAPSAASTVAGRATVTFPASTFTKTAGVTTNLIYGYYVTDGAGNLLYAEKDPNGPIPMLLAGASYTVTPVDTYVSEF